jgi:hypothetical protein
MPAPLVGAAAVAAARLLAAQLAKQGIKKGVKKTSAKLASAIAKEAAGPKAKAPFPTYRKPSTSRAPRLRDVDGKPSKTTVRQQVGPKTKSGKFTEKKYPVKTNTKPPVSKPTKKSTKVDLPKGIPTRQQIEANRRGVMYKGKLVRLSPGQIKALNKGKAPNRKDEAELRPLQPTIESRLASRSEKLDVSANNASKAPQYTVAELRRYAQQLRDSNAKSPNVTPKQISEGRKRATMPTAERRAATIRETQQRAVAKARERGMSEAQIKKIIAKARAEAASIARKAAK